MSLSVVTRYWTDFIIIIIIIIIIIMTSVEQKFEEHNKCAKSTVKL